MTFVLENWDGILAVLSAAHVLAIAIVNLTPTPKDDEALAAVYRFVEVLAGVVTPLAKMKP